MKRWIIAGLCLATAACQTNELQTGSVEQGLQQACFTGGNYPGAKLPQMTPWNGAAPPSLQPGQLYMDWADLQNGRHLAFIVDPVNGVIPWGAIVQDKDVPAYRASLRPGTEPMIGDCCRPPPPPIGGGDDWRVAATVLEAGALVSAVPETADQFLKDY
jgi:hypothetical protein